MGGFQQRPWTPTKRRGPIAAEYKSPGPACVALPSYIGKKSTESKTGAAPAFSFGAKTNAKLDTVGPGPGQYNVAGLSAKGKDNPPAVSLHGRHKDAKPDNFPAPGNYDPDKAEKVIHNSPKYTFGLKVNVEKAVDTPAPNVYNIPAALGAVKEGNKKSAPAYTLSGRHKDPVDERVKNPGPGTYNNVDTENYKIHSPAYTISSRYNLPSDSTQIPGPGVYSPEKVILDIPQAYTFGVKHSPYAEHY